MCLTVEPGLYFGAWRPDVDCPGSTLGLVVGLKTTCSSLRWVCDGDCQKPLMTLSASLAPICCEVFRRTGKTFCRSSRPGQGRALHRFGYDLAVSLPNEAPFDRWLPTSGGWRCVQGRVSCWPFSSTTNVCASTEFVRFIGPRPASIARKPDFSAGIGELEAIEFGFSYGWRESGFAMAPSRTCSCLRPPALQQWLGLFQLTGN